ITDITNLGFGVGRHDGLVIFVSGAVPGDVAEVKIIKVNKSYAIARPEKIITPSDHRCSSNCPYSSCKSCAYKELNYSYELSLKKKTIENAFLAEGLKSVKVESVTPSKSEKEYRNKAQYPISITRDGEYVIGFFAPKSHRVTEAAACPLAPAIFGEINEALRAFFKKNRYTVYDEEKGEGLLRHIYLRRGEISGEVMLVLVINGASLPKSDELVALITERFPAVVGILINENKENTNVILGNKYTLLYGRDYILDTLAGVDMKITAPSFYQVNHGATELLYAKARELAELDKGDVLLDLFCGIGSIGLSMAEDAGELIGIEIVQSAVECAKENAAHAGLTNAKFFAGDAAETENLLSKAESALGRKIKPDVIILDPPRAGCDERLVRFAASLSPKRIVYISCNPTTLARDVKRFAESGYSCDTVFGFDLFPHTGHVESVVCLTRRLDN
ncbi:MAG: 23S rRNA (uracil(1939)-C(5))-methyltransferase RlmD, partial [Clostridia bacterium]|nr:23S rRNA (uracil(1939)-C(5))-methyltransferase RlmD [Clostridia bacterium]